MSYPVLYEINTRCWLQGLSQESGTAVTLAAIPDSEFAWWQKLGFTHIWLMGAWTTGPRARAEALSHPDLCRAYDQALPGWHAADVAGSPYAVGDYRVPSVLGGEEGLVQFRRKLRERGMKLVLDFVPNHVGLDHAWIRERPELFVQSAVEVPGTIVQQGRGRLFWLAHGKDPYFAPWSDTVQLDYRRPVTRAAMIELLASIAGRCDGVRCDMAMLLLNEIFAKTWERFEVATPPPTVEFWASAISAIKQKYPEFLFLAEAYWGLEQELQTIGFDYTYDKTLYDALVSRDTAGVQRHLLSLSGRQLAAGAHFLENHDEPRIAAILSPAEQRAAAIAILGLPGMRFLHDCQLSGARIKLPVQLARRTAEAVQADVRQLYEQLLTTLQGTAVGQGCGRICRPRAAWDGNPTAENFVIIQWQRQASEFDLVVVNLAAHRSQCYAPLSIEHLASHNWTMRDLLGQEQYVRSGADLQTQGLYLDLPERGAQLFHFEPTN